jgi:hypothetical protein
MCELEKDKKARAWNKRIGGNFCMIYLKGAIVWSDTLKSVSPVADDHGWEVEVPKRELKKMTFGEAYQLWQTTYIDAVDIVSVLTGRCLSYTGSYSNANAEFAGLWTVKGVYEDE